VPSLQCSFDSKECHTNFIEFLFLDIFSMCTVGIIWCINFFPMDFHPLKSHITRLRFSVSQTLFEEISRKFRIL
jgi:hypothetical protein